jgi:hypothetical protein
MLSTIPWDWSWGILGPYFQTMVFDIIMLILSHQFKWCLQCFKRTYVGSVVVSFLGPENRCVKQRRKWLVSSHNYVLSIYWDNQLRGLTLLTRFFSILTSYDPWDDSLGRPLNMPLGLSQAKLHHWWLAHLYSTCLLLHPPILVGNLWYANLWIPIFKKISSKFSISDRISPGFLAFQPRPMVGSQVAVGPTFGRRRKVSPAAATGAEPWGCWRLL